MVKVIQLSGSLVNTAQTLAYSLIDKKEQKLLPDGVIDAYPLTKLQLGMVFHSEYEKNTSTIYHDVFSYHLKAPIKVHILEDSIQDIVARHPVLRTSIVLDKFSEPIQLVHSQVVINLSMNFFLLAVVAFNLKIF